MEATVRLAVAPELEGVSGRFYDRQAEARAAPPGLRPRGAPAALGAEPRADRRAGRAAGRRLERPGQDRALRGLGLADALRPASVRAALIPAAVVGAAAAPDEALLLEPGDEPRESALAHVDVLDELLQAAAAALALGQALERLELGDGEPVVALEVAFERGVDPRVAREQLAPLRRRARCRWPSFEAPSSAAEVHACADIACTCM